MAEDARPMQITSWGGQRGVNWNRRVQLELITKLYPAVPRFLKQFIKGESRLKCSKLNGCQSVTFFAFRFLSLTLDSSHSFFPLYHDYCLFSDFSLSRFMYTNLLLVAFSLSSSSCKLNELPAEYYPKTHQMPVWQAFPVYAFQKPYLCHMISSISPKRLIHASTISLLWSKNSGCKE